MKNSSAQKVSLLFIGIILAAFCPARASGPDASGIEFFEQKIRPLLADNCYKCHSAQSEKIKGGLTLDTKEGLLKGGDSGPAIVPGDPEKSLLIKAVRYTDENLQMPPKGKKLSAEQIASLEAWVKMGAPDPRTGTATVKSDDIWTKAKNHWAFQPIRSPAIPATKNKPWVKSPIDAFVLAKLEANHLKPSAPADKRTLIRRATFDLTGLPPTAEEVDSFLKDDSTNAFAKVVDRLLASPRYGERWGRHWLDVARYADTKGYLAGNEERRFPFSYTYRDWVIRSLNEDLPYDQFLIDQIAADQVTSGENKQALAAMGFLTLGRRFLNNRHDIIDDRIDVVTRGLIGLTVACARCHDHKFDPIPTKDYYSLYGVFASSKEPHEKPLLGITPPQHPEYLAEKKKREDNLTNFRTKKEDEKLEDLRRQVPAYLMAWAEFQRLADKSKPEQFAQEHKLDHGVLQRWTSSLESWKKSINDIFVPWFAFAALEETNFSTAAKNVFSTLTATTNHSINPVVAGAFTNSPVSLKDVADTYGKLLTDIDTEWKKFSEAQRKLTNDVSQLKLADTNREAVRQVLYAADAPPNLPRGELDRLFDVPTGQHLAELRRQIDELDATHPGALPRAMSLRDGDLVNPHVFVRGNAGNPGPQVPRQFLKVLAGENRKPFEKGSGRLELAQAIASRDNPLTSRVLVNRVWLHHFGKGFVKTPSDFGLRSDPPTHPELLDWLASEFMDKGWSLKKLHRTIMLSGTYQQSSNDNPDYAQIDPGNVYLWKMNRQRLEFEELRDSLLYVSGKLDLSMGGLPVDIISEPFAPRRTIYGFIDRQNLPGVFRTFDFANPDTTSAQRFSTTVPQQALFLLNSPFVVQQAQAIISSTNFHKLTKEDQKVSYLYRKVYQRDPDRTELRLGEKFIANQSAQPLKATNATWQYGFGAVDEKTKRVKEFHPFKHFTGKRWQNSATFPDPATAYAMLDGDGGHPGSDAAHCVIRRWVSPFDGLISIEGTLQDITGKGDGVTGRIISSHSGLVGSWTNSPAGTVTSVQAVEVRKGHTIDFVTDCRSSPANDSFKWNTVIKVTKAKYGAPPPEKMAWDSRNEFKGPVKDTQTLSAWEKYAQALLLSNEFIFVD